MEPIAYRGDPDAARTRLLALLARRPRVKIVETRAGYVHAVFTSFIFRFKDDVEFAFDPDEGVIHFRSASRVGRSDLGANRRRMEQLTADFQQLDSR